MTNPKIVWDDILVLGAIYRLHVDHVAMNGLYYIYCSPTGRDRENKLISLKTGRAWNVERMKKVPKKFTRIKTRDITFQDLMA